MPHETLKLTIADAAIQSLPDIADPQVQVWRENDGSVCAYGHNVDGAHWMHLPELASFCFSEDVDGVTAIPHPPIRENLILDAYRRNILPMVLQVRGWEMLHASAVLTPYGAVALCAVSGTGKSTTAFALSRQGWPLWADDAVGFDTSDPEGVKATALPFSIRLRPEAARFFDYDPKAPRLDQDRDGVKDQVEAKSAPLAALLVLDRTRDGGETAVRIRKLSSSQAFLDVLTHAYCFSLHNVERKRSMMRHYLDLAGRVPVFKVCFQPGFETLPAVVDGIARLVGALDKTECAR